jgi:hypothetical protein
MQHLPPVMLSKGISAPRSTGKAELRTGRYGGGDGAGAVCFSQSKLARHVAIIAAGQPDKIKPLMNSALICLVADTPMLTARA